MSILDEIFASKRSGLEAIKSARPARDLEDVIQAMPSPPDFVAGLRNSQRPGPRLIAEIKRRSPSRGNLSPGLDPAQVAQVYADNGASAISVLTEEHYFGGSLEDLRLIHCLNLGVPLLRKDFIFERYQLLEARAAGASAALLIVAMLNDRDLSALIATAHEFSLTALVEVHNKSEVHRALGSGAQVIGINNRDLHDFTVDLGTCERLRPLLPSDIVVVAESGIHTQADVQRLSALGIDAILVGEALVTSRDIASRTAALSGTADAENVRDRRAWFWT